MKKHLFSFIVIFTLNSSFASILNLDQYYVWYEVEQNGTHFISNVYAANDFNYKVVGEATNIHDNKLLVDINAPEYPQKSSLDAKRQARIAQINAAFGVVQSRFQNDVYRKR